MVNFGIFLIVSPILGSFAMYCCAASKTCWLRSTCKDVCTQRHDAHSPDCNLYSSSCSLTAEEKITVCIDEEAFQRIKLGRSIRLLHSWAKQLRLKNYKRLTLNLLCENLAKVVLREIKLCKVRKKITPKTSTFNSATFNYNCNVVNERRGRKETINARHQTGHSTGISYLCLWN